MKFDLPQELRRFILTSVPSVPFLEAVLLLRANPGESWTASRLAGRLYLPEKQADELLGALAEAGMTAAGEGEGTRYAPATPELAQMLDRLALAYSSDLVGVTDLIHSRVEKRAQTFADAFRWRKD